MLIWPEWFYIGWILFSSIEWHSEMQVGFVEIAQAKNESFYVIKKKFIRSLLPVKYNFLFHDVIPSHEFLFYWIVKYERCVLFHVQSVVSKNFMKTHWKLNFVPKWIVIMSNKIFVVFVHSTCDQMTKSKCSSDRVFQLTQKVTFFIYALSTVYM